MIELLLDEPPVLVVNKPGGLLTQSPPKIDSLEDRVRCFEQERAGTPGKIYLAVLHRLDRPVSGAIVFARNVRAARRISEQFQGRLVDKRYWVLVEGQVESDRGTWRNWVRKVPGEARAEVVDASHPEARLAVLHFQVQRRDDFGSWLIVKLETGRMHQIRLQASHQGHPVLGDHQYGATQPFGPPSDDHRARWIALHSRYLAFAHPRTRALVEVTAPIPTCWQTFRQPSFWQRPDE